MWIMASAIQSPNILITHVGDHFQQFRILAKKVSPRISTALGFKGLIFPVDGFFHSLPQKPLVVFGQKRIPVGTP